ncbi:hypothetical protein E2C01_004933 [Portunus trituberculatus]|uniref:Uncharacterized protein n=1 Tax=Portunus trituberculatus TaxID=210409 RepID=A0A5B7CTN7_PORTR|nr:hypothetical protein [Portunus trituberculatus]
MWCPAMQCSTYGLAGSGAGGGSRGRANIGGRLWEAWGGALWGVAVTWDTTLCGSVWGQEGGSKGVNTATHGACPALPRRGLVGRAATHRTGTQLVTYLTTPGTKLPTLRGSQGSPCPSPVLLWAAGPPGHSVEGGRRTRLILYLYVDREGFNVLWGVAVSCGPAHPVCWMLVSCCARVLVRLKHEPQTAWKTHVLQTDSAWVLLCAALTLAPHTPSGTSDSIPEPESANGVSLLEMREIDIHGDCPTCKVVPFIVKVSQESSSYASPPSVTKLPLNRFTNSSCNKNKVWWSGIPSIRESQSPASSPQSRPCTLTPHTRPPHRDAPVVSRGSVGFKGMHSSSASPEIHGYR